MITFQDAHFLCLITTHAIIKYKTLDIPWKSRRWARCTRCWRTPQNGACGRGRVGAGPRTKRSSRPGSSCGTCSTMPRQHLLPACRARRRQSQSAKTACKSKKTGFTIKPPQKVHIYDVKNLKTHASLSRPNISSMKRKSIDVGAWALAPAFFMAERSTS